MNNTKKTLLILSIIFNFASIGYKIYCVVAWFMLAPSLRSSVADVVFYFLEIASILAVNVLLIICLWDNGKLFRARYSYYMIALVLSIVMNLFSFGTLFLICTMFVSDWQWVKPEKDDKVSLSDNVEVITKTKEEKIAQLRQKKESGQISEEEFQKELLKLV